MCEIDLNSLVPGDVPTYARSYSRRSDSSRRWWCVNTCAGLVHHRQAIEYVPVPPSPRVADLPIELACFQINVSGMATNILKHKKDSESFIYILEI